MKQTMLEKVIQARKDFFNNVNVDSNSLNDLAEEIANVKRLRKYIEDVEEELKVSWKALASKAYNVMEEKNIETFTTGEGVEISKELEVRGKIEDSKEFFLWLAKKEDEHLGKIQLDPSIIPDVKKLIEDADTENVKLVVHWKRLKAYVKDVCDVLDAKTWPDGVTIESWEEIKVKY